MKNILTKIRNFITKIAEHSVLIRGIVIFCQKFSHNTFRLVMESPVYKRVFFPFFAKFHQTIKEPFIFYIRMVVVSIAVIVVALEVWHVFYPSLKTKHPSTTVTIKRQTMPQPALPTLPPIPVKKETPKKTEEEIYDEETEIPNPSYPEQHEWKEGTWSLLKTALPSVYYQAPYMEEEPKVAFILTGLGLNKEWTEKVLVKLHGDVTIVINPYSTDTMDQLLQVESLGYQGVIGLPLEPYDYPNPDPGPLTILTGVTPDENRLKTITVLKKTPKNTSVLGEHGSRFTISHAELEPVLKEIQRHGGIFIDPRNSLHSKVPEVCQTLRMTCHQVDLTIPLSMNSADADEILKKIIQNAKENGILVVSVPAIPAFIDFLLNWMDRLSEEGITLTTISDLPPMESVKLENVRQNLH